VKRIIILFLPVISALSAYSQTYLQDGDHCFEAGDYVCAETKYEEALEFTGKEDLPKVEIGLTRARQCARYIKDADEAFEKENYGVAKENYQKVLDSNPKDTKAKLQLEECNNFLATASIQEGKTCFEEGKYACAETKYSEALKLASGKNKLTADKGLDKAKLCAKSIKAADQEFEKEDYKAAKEDYQIVLDTNPQDAYAKSRLEKCSELINPANIKVSKETLSFSQSGGSERIEVEITNAGSYSVDALPSWCTKQEYEEYFVISCRENAGSTKRTDYFTVTAGNKKVRINVEQTGKTVNRAGTATVTATQKPVRTRNCFNCPGTRDNWGLTLGYADYDNAEGVLFGPKFEPLFKYGFGLNTGINFEARSYKIYEIYEFEFDRYTINIPLHLEYRLNFSKWFNMFFYGGLGFNAVTDADFSDYLLPVTFEYGGGFRISHIQFGIGKSLYIGDFKYIDYFGQYNYTYQNYAVSISYMF
jgi:tetratricopeptide (TPR) repeat protein